MQIEWENANLFERTMISSMSEDGDCFHSHDGKIVSVVTPSINQKEAGVYALQR